MSSKSKIIISCLFLYFLMQAGHIFSQDNTLGSDSLYNDSSYLGQKTPGMKPEIFAPGIISTDANEHSCAFYPDGREFYFTRIINRIPTIMVTKLIEGKWTTPAITSFSGTYNDRLPSISPDGQKLFFESIRPFPTPESKEGHKIWMVERSGSDWGKPQPLDLKFEGRIAGISMSNDGTLYGKGIAKISYVDGHYQNPVMLNSKIIGDYPFIAPDESYILYCSGSQRNITVSFQNENGNWEPPRLLTSEEDSYWIQGFPMVSPDGLYLFFTADHDIYWMDAKVIFDLEPVKIK